MRKILITILLLYSGSLIGQDHATGIYYPQRPYINHLIDRFDILYDTDSLGPGFTNFKPFLVKDILEYENAGLSLNATDHGNLDYLTLPYEWNAGSKKPIFKYFFRHPTHLWQVHSRNFNLAIDPLLHFEYGYENGEGRKYINTRGVRIYGNIAGKVGFYSHVKENQADLMGYVEERIENHLQVIPGVGRTKTFKESAYDWNNATGYLVFRPIEQIHVQFGQDKNFIGNGYRSLIFSDNSKNYLFLKLNTRVWKINYTNLFTQMMDYRINSGDRYIPRKYLALHHLGFEILPNLEIGLFEAVVFGNPDSTIKRSFDLNYLNPIIFYRSVEYQLGSSDNVLIGLDWKWNFLKSFSFYGQVMLDEFKYWELIKGTGWWANKFGVQAGLKYLDAFGIPHLDLQTEVNTVRPYTYTHYNEAINYAHFGQALAHPLGANFVEAVGLVRYKYRDLSIQAKLISANYGADNDSTNFGQNIFENYQNREKEYENYIGQGFPTNLLHLDVIISYMVRHDLWVDLRFIQRRVRSVIPAKRSNGQYLALALRWNLGQRYFDF